MKTLSGTTGYPFLQGGGEMGALTRNVDWSQTALGAPDQWPQSLRTTLSIVLNSRFPMFLFWGPQYLCFYNDAYRPSLGAQGRHPAMLGKPAEQAWPDIWSVIKPILDQIMAGGQATYEQDRSLPILRNGQLEEVYWTASYSPVVDESGAIAGVFAACFENTNAVLTRRVVEENQRQLLASFEQTPIGVAVVIDADKLIYQMANPSYSRMLDRRPEELVGKPMRETIPEIGGQGFDQRVQHVFRTGKPFAARETSTQIRRGDQLVPIYADYYLEPLRSASGTITGVLIVKTDVTHQVVARRAVEASEERFRSLVEQAPVAMAIFRGPNHIIEIANEAHLKIWGRQAHEVVGKPVFEALPEGKGQGYEALLMNVLTTGESFYADELSAQLIRNGQSETVYFNFVYQPLREIDGTISGVAVVANEITEQVLARQQLIEQKTYLQTALSIADLGTFAVDTTTGIAVYSENIRRWLDLPTNRESLERVVEKIHPADRSRVQTVISHTLRSEDQSQHDLTYRLTGPTPESLRYMRSFGKAQYTDGKPETIIGILQDVTAQVLAGQHLEESEARYRTLSAELEQQVQQRTEQLQTLIHDLKRSNENLQQFAYIASHDLQEPLRKIQQFGDLLKSRYADSTGDNLVYLERMQSAASRMSTLIRDLLDFSRISTQREATDSVPLSALVTNVLTTLELTILETKAEISVEPLPTVLGDASQLSQLFQNLLSNALKFRRLNVTPVVQIRCRTLDVSQLPALVTCDRAKAIYYRIDVADNGIGFDEKYLDRIFQVFQRLHSKSEFAGTGIGLAICEKVVANHGGTITAISQPGQGTTFSVYLPV